MEESWAVVERPDAGEEVPEEVFGPYRDAGIYGPDRKPRLRVKSFTIVGDCIASQNGGKALAMAINEAGEVLAQRCSESQPQGQSELFVWKDGEVRILPSPLDSGRVVDLTDDGAALLMGRLSEDYIHPYVVLPDGTVAESFPRPPYSGVSSGFSMMYGRSINKHGLVVGGRDVWFLDGRHEYLLGFDSPRGPIADARDINDKGWIAGYSIAFRGYSDLGLERWVDTAVRWAPDGGIEALKPGPPGGKARSVATAINERGEVVGIYASWCFFWSNGISVDLDPPIGWGSCDPYNLNDDGWVVGRATGSSIPFGPDSAMIWKDGQGIELKGLLPSDFPYVPWRLNDINNSLQAVGDGLDRDGRPFAFLVEFEVD